MFTKRENDYNRHKPFEGTIVYDPKVSTIITTREDDTTTRKYVFPNGDTKIVTESAGTLG